MLIREHAEASPTNCVACGGTNEPVLDTEADLAGYGRVHLCIGTAERPGCLLQALAESYGGDDAVKSELQAQLQAKAQEVVLLQADAELGGKVLALAQEYAPEPDPETVEATHSASPGAATIEQQVITGGERTLPVPPPEPEPQPSPEPEPEPDPDAEPEPPSEQQGVTGGEQTPSPPPPEVPEVEQSIGHEPVDEAEADEALTMELHPDELTRDELLERARDLNIKGRTAMNKDELAAAIAEEEENA